LKKGEFMVHKGIKSLEFLNDDKLREIKRVKDLFFEIENTNKNNNKYISNGIIEEYKMPKKYIFESFKNNFINFKNNYITIDASKKKSNILLHFAFIGLHLYYSDKNEVPINFLKKTEEIVKIYDNFF
jgi:hypothetical protein